MLLKIRLIFVFTLLLINITYANVDSLRQIWTDIAQDNSARFDAIDEFYVKYLFVQPDSAIYMSKYHFQLAKQQNLENEKAQALNKRAIAYNVKGDTGSALIEMNKVVDIYSSLKDSIQIIKAYNNIALIYTTRNEYQEALNYYFKCQDFYQLHTDKNSQAKVLGNIGLIHLLIESFDLGLQYSHRALEILKKVGSPDDNGTVWSNIARANLGKTNYEKAIESAHKALIFFQDSLNEYGVAACYILLAKVYQEINQIDTALLYVNKGLNLHQKIGNELLVLRDQVILANLIYHTDVNGAIEIGEEVLKKSQEYDNYSLKADLYDLLFRCYKHKKQIPLAISMLEKHDTYSDSLKVDQNKIAVIKKSIQEEYETKLFDSRLESELSQGEMTLSQQVKYYIISFLGSTLLLCIFLFHRAKRIIFKKDKEILNSKILNLKQLLNTQNKLIEADKMASLGQLTSGVAHEINNPINFIATGVIGLKKTLGGFVKSSNDDAKNDLLKEMNQMIAAIEEGAQRTSKIVKSLRQFSRDDNERYTEVNIVTGIESTLTLLANKLAKGVIIEKNYDKKEILAFCYPGKINQVFMNILLNAIQAIEESGVIRISVIDKSENILISISDTGVGISESEKQKIFEPFYTTKGIQEGTGLGLSISNEIIANHKGSIEVKDHKPKGAIFIIKLPRRNDILMNFEFSVKGQEIITN